MDLTWQNEEVLGLLSKQWYVEMPEGGGRWW